MMKRTTHADEMNRCAHAAHAHDVSPGPSSPALLLQPTAAPHMPPHKMFPSFLDHLCGPSLSLSHSGLISFDGKMNVIISLPQKKISLFRCPFPAENRNSPFVLHMPPPLYFEWNCGVASHPARRHGIAVLNLFVCAGATHGVVAAKGCERPCSPRSAPARARRARRPSVESPSDVTGYSLTLWLSR